MRTEEERARWKRQRGRNDEEEGAARKEHPRISKRGLVCPSVGEKYEKFLRKIRKIVRKRKN